MIVLFNVWRSGLCKFLCRLFLAVSIAVLLIVCINGIVKMERIEERRQSYLRDDNLNFYDNKTAQIRNSQREDVSASMTERRLEGGELTHRKHLDIVLVDKQCKVLRHWYKVVQKKRAKYPNNKWMPYTLIHFDVRSDVDPLACCLGTPGFKWPEANEDFYNFSCKSNTVIQAAAMTGLIDAVIWVQPQLNTDETDNSSESQRARQGRIEFGVYDYHTDNSEDQVAQQFCYCATVGGVKTPGSEGRRECRFSQSNDQRAVIPDSNCVIKAKVEATFVGDDVMLNAATQLIGARHIILDIDNNFFNTIGDENHNTTYIDRINQMLEGVFCPKNIIREQNLQSVLQSQLFSGCRPYNRDCAVPSQVDKSVMAYTKCPSVNIEAKLTAVYDFIISRLYEEQRDRLFKVGFCPKRMLSPAGISKDKLTDMVVCINQTSPLENGEHHLLPAVDKSAVLESIANARAIIGQFIQQCDLITISDSLSGRKDLELFVDEKLVNSLTNLLERSEIGYELIDETKNN